MSLRAGRGPGSRVFRSGTGGRTEVGAMVGSGNVSILSLGLASGGGVGATGRAGTGGLAAGDSGDRATTGARGTTAGGVTGIQPSEPLGGLKPGRCGRGRRGAAGGTTSELTGTLAVLDRGPGNSDGLNGAGALLKK